MERHGACVSLSQAAQRLETLNDVTGPYQFAERLRSQGTPVQTREVEAGTGRVVVVEAPEQGLSLLFIERRLCP